MAFEGMSAGFRDRAHQVQARLTGPDAAFVLAASPAAESTRHALGLLDRLDAAGVPLAGVVVNRVHLWPGGDPTPRHVPEPERAADAVAALAAALAADDSSIDADAAARAALSAADGYAAWVRADAETTGELSARSARLGGFEQRLPELSGDVHDPAGLDHVASWLFGRAARAARAAEGT
jgi:hypothetical protein